MKNMIKMVVTLSLISAVAAGALAFANRVTRDRIAYQAKRKAARAVKKIFPTCIRPQERVVRTGKGEEITVYSCPEKRSCFVFSSDSGSGISRPYSGRIKVMVGVDRNGSIQGLEIIRQSETPGLGSRIAEKSWLRQFKGLSLTKGKLVVKKVDRSGSIDAISGATISSKAVTSLVAAALRFYRDKVARGAGVRFRPSRRQRRRTLRRVPNRRVPSKRGGMQRRISSKKVKNFGIFHNREGVRKIRKEYEKQLNRTRENGVTGPPKAKPTMAPTGGAR